MTAAAAVSLLLLLTRNSGKFRGPIHILPPINSCFHLEMEVVSRVTGTALPNSLPRSTAASGELQRHCWTSTDKCKTAVADFRFKIHRAVTLFPPFEVTPHLHRHHDVLPCCRAYGAQTGFQEPSAHPSADSPFYTWPNGGGLVHRNADVDATCKIEVDAVVHEGARIGARSIIQSQATVGGGVVIGEDTTIR